jgi:hypothetical protein
LEEANKSLRESLFPGDPHQIVPLVLLEAGSQKLAASSFFSEQPQLLLDVCLGTVPNRTARARRPNPVFLFELRH